MRPLVVLGAGFLGTSAWAAAGAGSTASRGRELAAPPGHSLNGSAELAYLQLEDGGDRYIEPLEKTLRLILIPPMLEMSHVIRVRQRVSSMTGVINET